MQNFVIVRFREKVWIWEDSSFSTRMFACLSATKTMNGKRKIQEKILLSTLPSFFFASLISIKMHDLNGWSNYRNWLWRDSKLCTKNIVYLSLAFAVNLCLISFMTFVGWVGRRWHSIWLCVWFIANRTVYTWKLVLVNWMQMRACNVSNHLFPFPFHWWRKAMKKNMKCRTWTLSNEQPSAKSTSVCHFSQVNQTIKIAILFRLYPSSSSSTWQKKKKNKKRTVMSTWPLIYWKLTDPKDGAGCKCNGLLTVQNQQCICGWIPLQTRYLIQIIYKWPDYKFLIFCSCKFQSLKFSFVFNPIFL